MPTMKVAELETNGNVRSDLRLDDAFVESIREHGVLEPIILNDGKVWDGHRRLAGAIAAGRDEVPVHELGLPPEDRIAIQVVANVHRNDLTPMELAQAAWDLKVDCKLTQPQVAKALAMDKTVVSTMQKIGKSLADVESETQLATANQFTFEGLTDLIETADTSEDVGVGDILRVYGENTDSWDNSIRSAAMGARREAKVAEFMDEISDDLHAWSAAGIEVTYANPSIIEGAHDQWGHPKKDRKYLALGSGYDNNVDLDEHMKLECHVIQVDIPTKGWGEPRVVHWCKEFRIHEANGKSELKHKNAQKKADSKAKNSEQAKAQREAKQARREAAAEWIRKGGGRKSDIATAAIATLADQSHYDDTKKFCVILGLDGDKPAEVKGMDANRWFRTRWFDYLEEKFGDNERSREMFTARMVLASRFVEQNFGVVGDEARGLIDEPA